MAITLRYDANGNAIVPLASEFNEIDAIPTRLKLGVSKINVTGEYNETANLVPHTYAATVTETATASDVTQVVLTASVSETTTASDTTSGTTLAYITANLQVMLDANNPTSYPGSGTTWTDINPNGYTPQNFTLTNTVYFTDSSGGHLYFNGSSADAYSTYSYSPYTTVNATTTTYACWIKAVTNSGRKIFGFEDVQSGTGGFNYDKHMWIGTDGLLYIGVYNGGFRTVTGFPITDGTWHYLVLVYNASAPSITLYVDGVNCGSTPYVSSATDTWLRIGSYQLNGWTSGSTGYWPGYMAIFQKYLSALTQAEIRTNYNAWATRFGKSTGLVTSGLRLYLNANNYSGSGNWLDQSGNGYDMTLYNSPTFTSSATTPYFSFNGSNQYMNNASYTTPPQNSTTSFTWILLVNFTSGYTNYVAIGNRGTAYYDFMNITGYPGQLFQMYSSVNSFTASLSAPNNIWTTICVSKSGAAVNVYVSQGGIGGRSYSTTAGTNGGILQFYIAGDPVYGTYTNCKIAAVATYDRGLTFAEFVQMDSFMAGNYGA